ncbi:tRNA pseudouridine(55) synthase TruB [uncultured Odoribacter sp.]|uniref:tRNA pseudouridine(55) synthase TruB n=1 Tax=uncultured Odoribacter sp. TaxID=876416 RepID=UPI00261DC3FD|nr:tRNA pseudouridine(55) synthase TruB [uncultured Odoribacter sp.]
MILFKEEGIFEEGALVLVDKPLKWTSFDVVNKIRWCLRRKYGKLKVGHAGTLDPLATGLVIVCIGKWTKQIESYMGQQKEYLAQICLGATTPSFDLETEIDTRYPWKHITRDSFEKILLQFTGEIQQIPPVYSAVRVDGVRAYEKARKGKGPEMLPRNVYIKEIEVVKFELPYVELRIVCGKGTYIRSLAHDIGKACGSGAYLSGLRRMKIGEFRVERANKMDDLIAFLQEKG